MNIIELILLFFLLLYFANPILNFLIFAKQRLQKKKNCQDASLDKSQNVKDDVKLKSNNNKAINATNTQLNDWKTGTPSDKHPNYDDWVTGYTLAQRKLFYWKIDVDNSIYVRRKFKQWMPEKVSSDVLQELNLYMLNGNWKYLANNVQKLYNGTETEGLGRFLYCVNSDTSFAQLSSHLGAIFTNSGVWECDHSEGKMKFRQINGNWSKAIREYYKQIKD